MADKHSGIKTKLVRELAELLVELDLSEIDVKDAAVRVRLTRGMSGPSVAAPVAFAPPPALAGTEQPAPVVENNAKKTGSDKEVPSPMVGTVYLCPSPDAAPYIEVGSNVNKGDTILIIEAMKTMNHIPAPQSGTVSAILVEDKQPVEFGEALVIIE
jgi:acetyl-CoA carboxylase biotin carboxyl carrier protein